MSIFCLFEVSFVQNNHLTVKKDCILQKTQYVSTCCVITLTNPAPTFPPMKNAIIAIFLFLFAASASAQWDIDTLGYTRQYKSKYHIGTPWHPANNEEFYLHTAGDNFITCKGGYIANFAMLPLKARKSIASMRCKSSEVSKVVCTQDEYHIRPWPEEDRKVASRHWWVVLADSTCLCFDRHGRFQMVEHYYDGLGERWTSMIPEKALSHIKQECTAEQKYHILRISVSDKGYRVYYWIETPGLITIGLPPSYLYDRNWNVIIHSRPI